MISLAFRSPHAPRALSHSPPRLCRLKLANYSTGCVSHHPTTFAEGLRCTASAASKSPPLSAHPHFLLLISLLDVNVTSAHPMQPQSSCIPCPTLHPAANHPCRRFPRRGAAFEWPLLRDGMAAQDLPLSAFALSGDVQGNPKLCFTSLLSDGDARFNKLAMRTVSSTLTSSWACQLCCATRWKTRFTTDR